MGNKFLALMADLDENTQKVMSGWYKALQEAGFKGVQTPDPVSHNYGNPAFGREVILRIDRPSHKASSVRVPAEKRDRLFRSEKYDLRVI